MKRYHPPEQQISTSQPNPCNAQNHNKLQDFSLKNGTKSGQEIFLLYDTLVELCKEKKMYFRQPILGNDYLPAKLSQGKTWFVFFYVKSPVSGKLQRRRIKVNRYSNKKERLALARSIMGDINARLALGWNPLLEGVAPRAGIPLFSALDDYLKVKAKEMRPNSMRSYRSFISVFKEWLSEHGFTDGSSVSLVTKEVATLFMNDTDDREDVSVITYNNYVRFFEGLFAWMIKKGYVAGNPFDGVEKKHRRTGATKKRRLLKPAELEKLISFLTANNPPYLSICLFCYCCFMRPKEIALLKCGDIDLKRQTVSVSGEIAKNGKDSVRTIPDAMMPFLRTLDLSDPDLFMFGSHRLEKFRFTPGTKPTIGQRISDYWRFVVRPGCGFGEDLQFYSLKDTGITNMLGDGVPISFVQQQADHSSVAMTAIYVGKTGAAKAELKGVDILPASSQ